MIGCLNGVMHAALSPRTPPTQESQGNLKVVDVAQSALDVMQLLSSPSSSASADRGQSLDSLEPVVMSTSMEPPKEGMVSEGGIS